MQVQTTCQAPSLGYFGYGSHNNRKVKPTVAGQNRAVDDPRFWAGRCPLFYVSA
jgi:hypothetical protein